MTTRRNLLTAALTSIHSIFLPMAWPSALTSSMSKPVRLPSLMNSIGGKVASVTARMVPSAKALALVSVMPSVNFKGLIPALQAGRADIAVSAIYITDDRKKVVDFTDPYYAGGLVVLAKKDGPIKTLKDLEGRKISVQVGTKSVNYLRDNYPKVQRVEVEKNQEMFNLVQIGRSDAAVTGKPAAKLFEQSTQGLTVLEEQITTEEYGIAVPKSKPELTAELNAALKKKIKADGTYDRLVNKWFEAPTK